MINAINMTTTISFDDYSKIDLRIGTITEVFDFNEAHKPAYKLTIDFGSVGIKKSSAHGPPDPWATNSFGDKFLNSL